MNPSILNIHDVNFSFNKSRWVLLEDVAREVGMNSAGDVFRKYHHLSEQQNTLSVVQNNRQLNVRRDLTLYKGGEVAVFLRKPVYVTDRFAKAVIAAVIAEREEKARQLSEPQLIPAHRAEQAA